MTEDLLTEALFLFIFQPKKQQYLLFFLSNICYDAHSSPFSHYFPKCTAITKSAPVESGASKVKLAGKCVNYLSTHCATKDLA